MNIPVLSSRIDSVTVYRQGALVCRTAIVLAAQPVPAQVKLINLPLSLDDASVRVRVEGEGGDLPVASDVRVALDLAVVDEHLPPPDDEALKQARRALAEVAEHLVHLRAQRRRFERLQIFERPTGKRGTPPSASPVRARLVMLDFRHKGIAALDERIQEALGQERRATRHKDDLEHRQRAASKARQARPHELRKAAIIALRGHTIPTHPVRVIVEYMVPGARWAPSYAISLAKDMSQATVSVRAVVAQRSGEDWSGVKLTLATADAQRWTELPELQVLRIGRRQPPVQRRGWRAPPIGARELFADFDRFLAANTIEAKPPAGTGRPEEPVYNMLDDDDESPADGRSMTRSGSINSEQMEMMKSMAKGAPPQVSAPSRSKKPQAPMPIQQARSSSAPGSPSFGAAPPTPMAASMDASVMPMPKRGGGIAGAIGGLLGGSGGGGGAPEGSAFAPQDNLQPEPEHAAAPEQLAYGNLRMPGPTDSRRGSLIVAQRRERYL